MCAPHVAPAASLLTDARSATLLLLQFASEDYCASVGCVRTPSRRELMYPRSAVVTAASAFGLQAIDLVCIDYKNLDALREEAREGREMGFTGKVRTRGGHFSVVADCKAFCAALLFNSKPFIQIKSNRFRPPFLPVKKVRFRRHRQSHSPRLHSFFCYWALYAEIAYATRIVDGFRKHDKEGIGAFALDGKVVDIPGMPPRASLPIARHSLTDRPVVREAEKILARAAMSKPKK